jgi:hypothetical protein
MREMKVYGISDNNDQCTFSGVTREDLRKAGMDDKTKALSESCLDNFDTQRDAVVVEHEAATDSANSHNRVHPAPAHRMHVIVPARNGVNAGSRVVRQLLPSHCCPLIAAHNILVLRGNITIGSSEPYIKREDQMAGAAQEHLKEIADVIRENPTRLELIDKASIFIFEFEKFAQQERLFRSYQIQR